MATLGRSNVGSVRSSAAVLRRIHCQSSWVTVHVISQCSIMSISPHGTHATVVCRRMLYKRTRVVKRSCMNPMPRGKLLVGKAESRRHFPKSLTTRNLDIWRGFFFLIIGIACPKVGKFDSPYRTVKHNFSPLYRLVIPGLLCKWFMFTLRVIRNIYILWAKYRLS